MLDIRSDDRPPRDVQLDRALLLRLLILRVRREEDRNESVDLARNAEYSDCIAADGNNDFDL